MALFTQIIIYDILSIKLFGFIKYPLFDKTLIFVLSKYVGLVRSAIFLPLYCEVP